jgi:F-type H+-transporting ATPase subunit delta
VAGNVVANVYANALLEIGTSKNILEQVEEELGVVANLFSENRDILIFLGTPGISADAKKEFIDKAFSGNFLEIIVNFLKVLIDNNRQTLLQPVHEAFKELIDSVNNRLRVTVVSSAKLDQGLVEKLRSALADKYKKSIILNEAIDESILGGIVLRIGDVIVDGSLIKDLKNIRYNLINCKVRGDIAYED